MTDRRLIMTNRIMLDRIIMIMIDKETGLGKQRMMYRATILMLIEATDTEGEKPVTGSQETNQGTLEITPEIHQEIGTEIEDSQKEAAALKTGEDTMKMKETGRPAMVRADIERVARSP